MTFLANSLSQPTLQYRSLVCGLSSREHIPRASHSLARSATARCLVACAASPDASAPGGSSSGCVLGTARETRSTRQRRAGHQRPHRWRWRRGHERPPPAGTLRRAPASAAHWHRPRPRPRCSAAAWPAEARAPWALGLHGPRAQDPMGGARCDRMPPAAVVGHALAMRRHGTRQPGGAGAAPQAVVAAVTPGR
jgi:hypothetical protein